MFSKLSLLFVTHSLDKENLGVRWMLVTNVYLNNANKQDLLVLNFVLVVRCDLIFKYNFTIGKVKPLKHAVLLL